MRTGWEDLFTEGNLMEWASEPVGEGKIGQKGWVTKCLWEMCGQILEGSGRDVPVKG